MIILDLDNCISNDEHRVPLIRWDLRGDARYSAYHALAELDPLGNADLLDTKELITIFTGRPVAFRDLTLRWLERHRIRPIHIIMRNNGDLRHSAVLKRQQLDWLLELYDVSLQEISCAYDDREDVVQMYRAAGLRAERRAIHSLDAYVN
jgi:hypothetical protein